MPGSPKHSWRRSCTCGPGEALLHWPRPEGRSPGIPGNPAPGGEHRMCLQFCGPRGPNPAPHPPPLSKENPEPPVLAKMFILSLTCVYVQVLNLRQ